MTSFWVADPNLSLEETFTRNNNFHTPPIFDLLLKKYLEFFSYDPEIGRHVPLFFGILSIPFLGLLSYQVSKNNSWDIRFSTMLSSIQFHLKNNSNKMVGNNNQKTNY